MKVSEAIKAALPLGLEQIEGDYYSISDDGKLCACAIGLALLGSGCMTQEHAKSIAETATSSEHMAQLVMGHIPSEWVQSQDGGGSPHTLAVTLNDVEVMSMDRLVEELEERGY